MKSQSLTTGLVLAAGLQTASAVGHQHGGQHAHFDKRPSLEQYATTTTTTTSVTDVTTITTTITVTPGVDATTVEVSPTVSPSEPSVPTEASSASLAPVSTNSDAGIVASLTIADALGSSTSPTSTHTSTSTSSTTTTRPFSSTTITSSSSLTPNGIKAGSAGGDAYPFWSNHIGWWYDWTPVPLEHYPDNTGTPIPVAMLWGAGTVSHGDALRYHEFLNLTSTPQYILGFEEPDCSPPDSADIASDKGAEVWNEVVAPWKGRGTLLGSPSMCKQSDEDWLTPFEEDITTSWDFTTIHINTISMDVVNKDLDYYWDTYGNRPIWVTEFACVDTSDGFTPSENQTQINQFIADIVDLLQNDDRVYAYAYSSGAGLGDTWPPVKDGELTESGRAYLDAISKYA
ncbi:hypothetical protein DPV78_004896 [Talaromyces pinophilus]|nr:hypothetical protein DPV78_004896 [Talaromyces pinophilus]